jgi:hypothetical protein
MRKDKSDLGGGYTNGVAQEPAEQSGGRGASGLPLRALLLACPAQAAAAGPTGARACATRVRARVCACHHAPVLCGGMQSIAYHAAWVASSAHNG